ncbi:uncharacterized protein PHACADRAFT_107413 [Phanerochaete carnosa HHB-10118-sp]|uniref:Uncharacterized protein n=1 Tax=Phanerochaete carnosa (strain HHB-10118-sp) TaxID=650164 RepID=K5VRD5_PHACS|nr:uncharacterized protein PHACADRAFT_107413 [Phanerochaete carnosa HHB-10118-sp]EKM49144.1 hypothetical protein PHACADRAFT_107413 [Phanerochaete carnosa HHB-10118-sp]
MTADNCCQSETAVKTHFPHVPVKLDVWHCMMRYLAAVHGSVQNPQYRSVAAEFSSSILESRAEGGRPAVYRTKDEQERRLVMMYSRFEEKGVWSAAAAKVHADQLRHVRKGCLTRPRNDLRSDGSRIEGTHKMWNKIMQGQPSGLEMISALASDHVLRYNMRVIMQSKDFRPSAFITSTHGSHHLRLQDHIAQVWNALLDQLSADNKNEVVLARLPVMQNVSSGETFGLIPSEHAATFGGLYLKEEPTERHEVIAAPLQTSSAPALVAFSELSVTGIATSAPAATSGAATQPLATSRHPASAASTVTVTARQAVQGHLSASKLSDPLPLPADLNSQGLTRSQRIFAISSGMDPRSLHIDSDEEFYLFMDLRAEQQWRSFAMNSHKYVEATHLFNATLATRAREKGFPYVAKNPRAILDKLGEMETAVLKRIKHQSFTCTYAYHHFET